MINSFSKPINFPKSRDLSLGPVVATTDLFSPKPVFMTFLIEICFDTKRFDHSFVVTSESNLLLKAKYHVDYFHTSKYSTSTLSTFWYSFAKAKIDL